MLREGLEPGRQDTHKLGPAQPSAAVQSGEAPSWGLSVYLLHSRGQGCPADVGSDLLALQDWPETERLLSSANVVPEALQRFARAAAEFATQGKLGKLEFARDARGRPDVSAFDFTSMMRADSSARVQEKHGARLLLGLVGDCLVEVRSQGSLSGGGGRA